MFLTVSFSIPSLSLKINKLIKKKVTETTKEPWTKKAKKSLFCVINSQGTTAPFWHLAWQGRGEEGGSQDVHCLFFLLSMPHPLIWGL